MGCYSVDKLKKMHDFKEVNECKSDCVIFGLFNDVKQYTNNPNFRGIIFNPERRREKWTYKKNVAFFVSAAINRKTMIIVSDLSKVYDDEYTRMKSKGRRKILVDEILWMLDNGYQLSVVRNIIVAKPPPVTSSDANEKAHHIKITDYRKFTFNFRLSRLKAIMNSFVPHSVLAT